MPQTRKNHSPSLKAKVAVEAIKSQKTLGNHLKSGQRLSAENRPTEVTQNKSSYSWSQSNVQTFFAAW